MKQYFFSKQWFRELYSGSYFIKVNNVWTKYSKKEIQTLTFKKGEKIQEAQGPGISNWIYCQNDECHSIINFGNSFIDEREMNGESIWDYKCSCCEKEQHFIPDYAVIACDEKGLVLST